MIEDIVERTEINERLKRNGWKVYADTTLRNWKKKDLIELIRCLEHNYSAMIERWENTARYAESRIKELEQIEKMKCCQNCKHYNTTEEYVLCNISHVTSCENLDKWEIKE